MAATAQQVNPRGAQAEANWQACLTSLDANLSHKPSAATAAVVTITAAAGRRHILRQIFASFSATPAAGATVKVEDGSGNTVWEQYVADVGRVFDFNPPLAGRVNTAMIVTLSSGAGSVAGALSVNAHDEL